MANYNITEDRGFKMGVGKVYHCYPGPYTPCYYPGCGPFNNWEDPDYEYCEELKRKCRIEGFGANECNYCIDKYGTCADPLKKVDNLKCKNIADWLATIESVKQCRRRPCTYVRGLRKPTESS